MPYGMEWDEMKPDGYSGGDRQEMLKRMAELEDEKPEGWSFKDTLKKIPNHYTQGT